MHDTVRDAFIPFNEPLEGRVQFMYLDVKSLVSTGVGNLLDADDPSLFGSNPQPLPDIFTLNWLDKNSGSTAGRAEITDEYQTVKFSGTAFASLAEKEAITRLRITNPEINGLVTRKLDSFEATLKTRAPFTSLGTWPADGQLGLFSMAWAMGPHFKFPVFQGAAAVQDWLTMARECRMTEAGNPGVRPRNVRNGLLFTLAGWMAAPPEGDFTQLVFDPVQKLDANMRSGNFPVPLNLTIGLQTALEVLGFSPNGLDGVFGKGTRAALVLFQSTNGLAKTPAAQSVKDVPRETVDAMASQLDDQQVEHFP
ncbi:peptidoglycan-binding protein [Streptomyces sp. ISL-1]|uniref:peptidoglycan-binding domain-containing protein n=1 Tax=Streptomyces sp. ISL-1 TaxID=2817657 RepID=UPI001BE4EB71|nr:peptidoglycan-binding domain-containing protein [Streptomyces sp. ISL-1]MBT2393404.1 peptidoglycan-binding protein [Streptomyces sp. ISL-1]